MYLVIFEVDWAILILLGRLVNNIDSISIVDFQLL